MQAPLSHVRPRQVARPSGLPSRLLPQLTLLTEPPASSCGDRRVLLPSLAGSSLPSEAKSQARFFCPHFDL